MIKLIIAIFTNLIFLSCDNKINTDPNADCNEIYNNTTNLNSISICSYNINYTEINIVINDTSQIDTIFEIIPLLLKATVFINRNIYINCIPKENKNLFNTILLNKYNSQMLYNEYDIIDNIDGISISKKHK